MDANFLCCPVDGCESAISNSGLCNRHLFEFQTGADPFQSRRSPQRTPNVAIIATTAKPPKRPQLEVYLENRDKILTRSKRIRERNKAFWIKEKGGRCVDCLITDVRVLHFDHNNPSEKEFSVGQLIGRKDRYDPDLISEMKKCVLRCANCHLVKSLKNGELGRKRKY